MQWEYTRHSKLHVYSRRWGEKKFLLAKRNLYKLSEYSICLCWRPEAGAGINLLVEWSLLNEYSVQSVLSELLQSTKNVNDKRCYRNLHIHARHVECDGIFWRGSFRKPLRCQWSQAGLSPSPSWFQGSSFVWAWQVRSHVGITTFTASLSLLFTTKLGAEQFLQLWCVHCSLCCELGVLTVLLPLLPVTNVLLLTQADSEAMYSPSLFS